jgi:hypothetical protein
MEKILVGALSGFAIVFSAFAFFLLNDLLLFGVIDLISLVLLSFAFMFYKESKHKQKYSFLKSINKINHLKSIGGVIGLVYLLASLLGFLQFSSFLGFDLILIIFNFFQVLAGVSIFSLAIWD